MRYNQQMERLVGVAAFEGLKQLAPLDKTGYNSCGVSDGDATKGLS
jgi:hypothetical protein